MRHDLTPHLRIPSVVANSCVRSRAEFGIHLGKKEAENDEDDDADGR